MSRLTSTPNSIDAFANMIREQFPQAIQNGTRNEVYQVEDRELVAWTENREAAFEIFLSNGASYQIMIKQIAEAEEHWCEACDEPRHDDEVNSDGLCHACQDALEHSAEREGAV